MCFSPARWACGTCSAHPLLPAAAELAYHTVNVSALNAEGQPRGSLARGLFIFFLRAVGTGATHCCPHARPCYVGIVRSLGGVFVTELRRENGLEVIGEAFTRCIDVVGSKTTESAPPTQVCMHIIRLLAAAAAFDRCRERIIAQPRMVANVSRCLYIQGAPHLTHAAVTAVGAMAIDATLQNMVTHAQKGSVERSGDGVRRRELTFTKADPGCSGQRAMLVPAHRYGRALAPAPAGLQVRLHARGGRRTGVDRVQPPRGVFLRCLRGGSSPHRCAHRARLDPARGKRGGGGDVPVVR